MNETAGQRVPRRQLRSNTAFINVVELFLPGSCRDGDSIDFSSSAGGSHEDGFLDELIIDGVPFRAGEVLFFLTVAPVPFRPGQISAPFTLRGTIRAFAEHGQAVVTKGIVGRGTMAVTVETLDCCGTQLFTTSVVVNVEAGPTTAGRSPW